MKSSIRDDISTKSATAGLWLLCVYIVKELEFVAFFFFKQEVEE